MKERGRIALKQGILERPRWPFFRKYLGAHVRQRVGTLAVWGGEGAHLMGRGFYHIGATFGVVIALALLLPLCIPYALFLTGQFCVRYALTLRAADRIKAGETK